MEMMSKERLEILRVRAATGRTDDQVAVYAEHDRLRARVAELEESVRDLGTLHLEAERAGLVASRRAASLQAEVEQWKASAGQYFDALSATEARERHLQADVTRLQADLDHARWAAAEEHVLRQDADKALAESERKRAELVAQL